MPLNTKLLSLNPDATTLWNQRREIFLEQLVACVMHSVRCNNSPYDAMRRSPTEAAVHSAVAAEMALTQNALQTRNPKSYGAWHHRKWMLTLCCTGTAPGVSKHLSTLEQPEQLPSREASPSRSVS